jgi:hypothetical protein
MITQDKLREYIWAGGDIDGYARSGRRSDITDGDWFLIDGMLSAFSIIRRGLAADTFKKQHQDQSVINSPRVRTKITPYDTHQPTLMSPRYSNVTTSTRELIIRYASNNFRFIIFNSHKELQRVPQDFYRRK